MDLYVYDSKRKQKRCFEPLDPNHVKIYVCGPTVYDRVHIGNGLSALIFDVFVRVLRCLFPKVTYVRNITDVDDKINNRAHELGIPISELTQTSTLALHEDFSGLGILPPDVEPRATEHIAEIIGMIEKLIEQEHAYFAEGHVLFYVPSDPHYGSLTNKTLEQLIDGARVEVAPYKRDPKDFVLWKPSTPALPGWESPWGRGRPGWHIECSAMIRKHLGPVIDIHGGGSDLAFPHHENEMAQSGCLEENTDYVRYWMHNGMLNFGNQKMAKSLGNVQLVHDLLKCHSGESLRYALLSGHYRQTLRWDDQLIEQSRRSLESMYQALRRAEQICGPIGTSKDFADVDCDGLSKSVLAALLDDLNTPRALAGLHELVTQINQSSSKSEIDLARKQLLTGGWLLGLLTHSISEYFTENAPIDVGLIEQRIAERDNAKRAKDYAKADAIREQLLQDGVAIEDTREGTIWRVLNDKSVGN